MGAKVYFFFLSGAKKGRIEAVETGVPIKIGRHHDCQIQLDPYEDIPASGHHAVVFVAGDGYILEDAGSSWGTYKNDERLTGRVTITTGDVVLCGKDAEGREGPRLKFYLEKDVLRCPACDGPVYKRHFRCPGCARKFCLRCIDFRTKTCKPCGEAAAAKAKASPGYEVVEDDAEAAKPARVVVSGKDAARVKQAMQAKRPTPPPPDVVVKGDLDAPFCAVCCDFASEAVFTCPACRQTACVSHKRGAVCPPCAGVTDEGARRPQHPSEPELVAAELDEDVVAEPVAPPPKRQVPPTGRPGTPAPPSAPRRHLTANELVVPDLDLDDAAPAPAAARPRAPAEPTPRGGLAVPPAPRRVGSGSGADRAAPIPGTMRFPAAAGPPARPEPAAPPAVKGGVSPSPRPADPIFNQFNKIPAKRPQSIPCERCQAPLTASSFFVCDRCRARLCGAHRSAAAPASCDACAAQRPAATRPPSGGGPLQPAPGPQAPRPPATGARPMATPPAPLPTLGGPPPRPTAPLPRPRQELIETADDVAAQALRGEGPLGLSGQPSAFPPLAEGVRFECPYCDEPLAADARRCRHCGREL